MGDNTLGKRAKEDLASLVREIDLRLKKYWDGEIESNFGFNTSQRDLVKKMLLHAREHNLRSAKRARASFVIYGYMLGQSFGWSEIATVRSTETRNDEVEIERLWRVAEGVEMIHTALLMHDDFMDQDRVRRGLPTTQVVFGQEDTHYGEAMAVNIGDAVLCLGYERILMAGFAGELSQKVMKQMLRGITNTAFGQAYDVSLPRLGELTEEKVMGLHKAKTAIYTYENPLLVGGILAGLSEEAFNILHEYAMDGGVAFQLQDDILGVYGDERKTGKSADSDLLQGKVTLLIVKVLELGNKDQKEAVLKVWGKIEAKKADIDLAKKAIKDSGSYQYSVDIARNLAEKSAETATKLRELNLNTEAIDYLEGIARYVVEREV